MPFLPDSPLLKKWDRVVILRVFGLVQLLELSGSLKCRPCLISPSEALGWLLSVKPDKFCLDVCLNALPWLPIFESGKVEEYMSL